MTTEKIINPPSGYAAFALFLLLVVATVFTLIAEEVVLGVVIGIINFVLVLPGLVIVNPNESKVLTLFGSYIGWLLLGKPVYRKKEGVLKGF
jgi:hypothetical protein